MNFFIFSSFTVFCVYFFIRLTHVKRLESKIDREYWEKEKKANFTRKKSLDNLDYINIPESLLNINPKKPDSELAAYLSDLKDMSGEKIVNLTGYTNTDLKLEYGTANITILSEYDLHYTNLVTLLQKIAELLCEDGDDEAAIAVLEFAIDTGSDVSKSYYLLSSLYRSNGTHEKIAPLIEKASSLRSLLKDSIVENLSHTCT